MLANSDRVSIALLKGFWGLCRSVKALAVTFKNSHLPDFVDDQDAGDDEDDDATIAHSYSRYEIGNRNVSAETGQPIAARFHDKVLPTSIGGNLSIGRDGLCCADIVRLSSTEP